MGSAFDSWNDVAGAFYVGAGTSWEFIWLAISIVMCVVALIAGAKHERTSYKKIEKD